MDGKLSHSDTILRPLQRDLDDYRLTKRQIQGCTSSTSISGWRNNSYILTQTTTSVPSSVDTPFQSTTHPLFHIATRNIDHIRLYSSDFITCMAAPIGHRSEVSLVTPNQPPIWYSDVQVPLGPEFGFTGPQSLLRRRRVARETAFARTKVCSHRLTGSQSLLRRRRVARGTAFARTKVCPHKYLFFSLRCFNICISTCGQGVLGRLRSSGRIASYVILTCFCGACSDISTTNGS